MVKMPSRKSEVVEVPWVRDNESELRRRSTPLMPMNLNSLNSIPPIPSIHSPPPTPLSPPPRTDRLSLRLTSNSGLKGHTNEAALSQYTDYKVHRPSVLSPNHNDEEISSSNWTESVNAWRNSSAYAANGLTSYLPLLDFLGKDAFLMAMDNPSVVRHLVRYCEDHCGVENIHFLLKIREYTNSTNDLASVLTSISTTFFTTLGASAPLNLPPMVSRPLNADVKRIAHSVLPGLESVFIEARSHVESRVASDIFPGFVKNQLAYCTASVLANECSTVTNRTSSKLEYPGLGESFCLSDALTADNAILGASDGFIALTGHALPDIVGQKCSFLQGPFTDPEGIRRIQVAIRGRQEAVELILNHRQDGESFWNLLFLIPLKDVVQQEVQYWLGAQVNVSEGMGSRRDMLRILNGGVMPDAPEGEIQSIREQSEIDSGRESRLSERGTASSNGSNGQNHKRQSSKTFSSRNRLFQSFRKTQQQSFPSGTTVPTSPLSYMPGFDSLATDYQPRKSPCNTRFSTQRFLSRKQQIQVFPTAYSHYLVLRYMRPHQQSQPQYQTASLSSQGQSQSQSPLPSPRPPPPPKSESSSSLGATTGMRKKNGPKMPIAYFSDSALDLLSLDRSIIHTDIFHALAESSSITRQFKATVREKMDAGKSVSLDLVVDNKSRSTITTIRGRRRGSSVGYSGSKGRADAGEDEERRVSSKNTGERGDRDKEKDKDRDRERVVRLGSHWTALRGGGGEIEWVVLVLTERV
ncbi:uncharacterized protein BCR38DRAFT_76278 [Pseudomassariella vexata]|uniref:RGS domain-containing protein n=1 Tax=Pseudomassariella vexata TaxID=1141098 RepID=A0A1Y2DFN9_9PEZI|nr:uncharacterized protein BCR38DRAFT_76278 [Pseudomassariella vexata]ORY58090.1 hypothetical protein BCR38DRAFT_76278 [Pseudomassariella vexata]